MSLTTKYRPQSLDEFYGNESTINALQGLVARSDCPHSFLISGPSGTGKTTLARILASTLGATRHDISEIDVADFRGIDTIREIQQQAPYAPLGGTARAWILDEAHKLSKDAQNAALKLLEEPPAHAYFVLCTTEPNGLIPTVRSRCSELSVSPLPEQELMRLLRQVVRQEGDSLSKKVYREIASVSEGRPRKALSVLERVLAMNEDKREATIEGADEEPAEVIDLCRALKDGTAWKRVSSILSELREHDPEAVRRVVLDYQSKALLGGDDRAAAPLEAFSEPFQAGFPSLVLAAYTAVHS